MGETIRDYEGKYEAKVTASNALVTSDADHTKAVESDGNGLPIYVGWAAPGTAKTAASWQIQKLTYSGTVMTDVQWASGNADFDKIWNNRASYSYS